MMILAVRRLVFVTLIPFIALACACRAATLENSVSGTPIPITVGELLEAIDAGVEIKGRTIQGADLAKALLGYSARSGGCEKTRSLNIVKSLIVGDIALGETDIVQPIGHTARHRNMLLPIAVSIRESTVSGAVEVGYVNFLCRVDLQGSTFQRSVLLKQSQFWGEFRADEAEFAERLSAPATSWFNLASFRKARFQGNVEMGVGIGQIVRFWSTVDFQEAVFQRYADFVLAEFQSDVSFAEADFRMDASFLGSIWGKASLGPFRRTEFNAKLRLDGASFYRMYFGSTIFRGPVSFSTIKGKSLKFDGGVVQDQIIISGAKLGQLEIGGVFGTQFEGELHIQNSEIDHLTFIKAVLKEPVRLDGSSVCKLQAVWSVFYSDLVMDDASLANETCKHSYLLLTSSRFYGALSVSSDQWLRKPTWWKVWRADAPRFQISPPSAWEDFRRAFEKAHELPLENDASYRVRMFVESKQVGVDWISSWASRIVWGYGLRPLRVVAWATIVILVFAAAYWTQLRSVGADRGIIVKNALRIYFAIAFSCRTALKLSYGYDNTRGALFSTIAMLESIVVKVLFAFFAYSLTQASPLFSGLVKGILP
ncbi:pentapeptide repeat-containing protein [Rhizobium leguminosarum]|uniref:pentapeptide repeat-containing protein n=1 Tax=Rhizobium leguminosarum TaxID=384 RepID=UPI00099026D2|nr:pentapeptide repeat-containing protein [Rhizobium leguminosarum]MBB5260823.1 uncharacterized protein YjbI with pentapeptide repeats [Rhizobium leguminosarum]MDX6000323.1 pentapeptide repeat-containing protein [Rhizobium leguminosarum]OOO54051.1 hypothetical protein BS629_05240 [Rhizobium leguminosarum bv. viciae USDA 2370]PUB65243.1 hypothetical protein DB728_07785 [Rhizobium leguminosarum bv. viciae USDA 2370]